MLTAVNPKLPMRNKAITREFYCDKLGFRQVGTIDYDGYLMVEKENVELHFFEYKDLDSKENYSGIYLRTDNIKELYQQMLDSKLPIHPAGALEKKPWGQMEFAMLDPDNTLLTFGQAI